MLDLKKPVRVFRNVKRHCYSIMQSGQVHASARQVHLAEVRFQVRESGRQRMLRESRFNVHAYAVGRLVDFAHPDDSRVLEQPESRQGYYDPLKFESFVDRLTHEPLLYSSRVLLDDGGVIHFARPAPEASPTPAKTSLQSAV